MRKIVVFTGSGVSAESGIRTFRDAGGLWEEYPISEVATPEAWIRNPELVQRFYNERRKQVLDVQPNEAHRALVKLEEKFEVTIITQNIDDLHERAGSGKVMHLHGEIRKSRSSIDENLIYEIEGWELKMGSTCSKGSQLRPYIVWFGEAVPMMTPAIEEVMQASAFLIIGTSLEVYPAASLIHFANPSIPKYYVDPAAVEKENIQNFIVIKEKAGIAVPLIVEKLLSGNL